MTLRVFPEDTKDMRVCAKPILISDVSIPEGSCTSKMLGGGRDRYHVVSRYGVLECSWNPRYHLDGSEKSFVVLANRASWS